MSDILTHRTSLEIFKNNRTIGNNGGAEVKRRAPYMFELS